MIILLPIKETNLASCSRHQILRVLYGILQVSYGIYNTCSDQSDYSICYN